MLGEILRAWPYMWDGIWSQLEKSASGVDLFSELSEELVSCRRPYTQLELAHLLREDSLARRRLLDGALILGGVRLEDVGSIARQSSIDKSSRDFSYKSLFDGVDELIQDRKMSRACLAQSTATAAADLALVREVTERQLQVVLNDPIAGKKFFKSWKVTNFAGEPCLVSFLERAHGRLEEVGGDALANAYFVLLDAFLQRYSLAYELRRPCFLCPTLCGLFMKFNNELSTLARADGHVNALLGEFHESIRDLRAGRSENKLKICIQKQMNLLEALGRAFPGVSRNTLGAICDEIGTWPHEKVKESLKNLYKFSCDYPGIRHAGTPSSQLRPIDSRDFFGVVIALAGLTTYLTSGMDADRVYTG